MLQTLSLETNKNSLNFLVNKLLSLRHIEYLTLDRELKIQEISLELQHFADFPDQVIVGKDVRASFLELIGIEEILIEIIEGRQESFQLKGIARSWDNNYLYLDLYIFRFIEIDNSQRLIIFYEDVTETMIANQSLVQVARETSLLLSALAIAHDYIDKILNSIADILLVTSPSGKIKIVNQAAQKLFGYSDSELIDKHISLITTEEGLLREVSQLPWELRRESWHQIEVVCTSKTGLKLLVAFSCSTIVADIANEEKEAKQGQDFVYIGRDITEQQRSRKRQIAQYSVARILSESTSIEEAMPKILQAICQSLGWDVGELWTPVDEDTQASNKEAFEYPRCSSVDGVPWLRRVEVWHRQSAGVGEFVENGQSIRFAPGEGLPGVVWVRGCSQWISDVVKDGNFPRSHLAKRVGLHSAFGFPIHSNGEVLAVMAFFCLEEQPPDVDLLQMMAAIGSQLGQFFKRQQAEKELTEAEASLRILYKQEKHQSEELTLKNLALEKTKRELEVANQELQRLASVDGLTQLANRRCFDETLEREWRRLAREGSPLSLVMCDIDFFKLYNDSYGHQGGDECLKEVAKILCQNARRGGDLAARYGGEELALILPVTDIKGALKVAGAIRSDLQARAIPHAASKVSKFVTLSIGVACVVPAVGLSIEELISEADKAMYRAKEEGRDRISILINDFSK